MDQINEHTRYINILSFAGDVDKIIGLRRRLLYISDNKEYFTFIGFENILPIPKSLKTVMEQYENLEYSIKSLYKHDIPYTDGISWVSKYFARIDPISENIENVIQDWQRESWGSISSAIMDIEAGFNTLVFMTYGVPSKLVKILSLKSPDIIIYHGWCDENCGNVVINKYKSGAEQMDEVHLPWKFAPDDGIYTDKDSGVSINLCSIIHRYVSIPAEEQNDSPIKYRKSALWHAMKDTGRSYNLNGVELDALEGWNPGGLKATMSKGVINYN